MYVSLDSNVFISISNSEFDSLACEKIINAITNTKKPTIAEIVIGCTFGCTFVYLSAISYPPKFDYYDYSIKAMVYQ